MSEEKLNHFDRLPGRLLGVDELALLPREPYHMFKPIKPILNKSHPLAIGLVGFELFNENSPKPRDSK